MNVTLPESPAEPPGSLDRLTPIEATALQSAAPKRRRKRRGPTRTRAVSVAMPESFWQNVRGAMLASRTQGNEEVFGFVLCERHRTAREDRYLARHWVVPTADDYEHQSSGGLTLKQSFHSQVLTTWLPHGLHIMHLHTHPGRALPSFSLRDDRNESALAAALHRLTGSTRLLSAVFDEEMEHGVARIWSGQDAASQPATLRVGWAPSLPDSPTPPVDPELFDRQRVFGEVVQRQLGQLTVAVIGCGGLGAPFIEQLSRLGVRSWVLVDDDRMEATNLHRLPFATPSQARRGARKVDHARGLIQRFWNGQAQVRAIARPIEDEETGSLVTEADLIVVCTDNHHSRLVAQELALRALRPLICLGTKIEQRPGEEAPRIYSRVTMPPLGGGWCLACGQVIDLVTASREAADPVTRALLAAGGYLPEVSSPAVYWVNTIGAAMGVRLVHGVLAGFIDATGGIDHLFDLAAGLWMPIAHDAEPGCYFCGAGDGDSTC